MPQVVNSFNAEVLKRLRFYEILPPCRGLFFGESTDEEWAKTAVMLHLVFNQFEFDDYDFYYHSEWDYHSFHTIFDKIKSIPLY